VVVVLGVDDGDAGSGGRPSGERPRRVLVGVEDVEVVADEPPSEFAVGVDVEP